MLGAEREITATHGPSFPLLVGILGIIVALLALWFVPSALGPVSAHLVRAGVLCGLAIAAWATGFLPEHITALLFFVLLLLFQIAPPEVVFSGFTTGAFWLVFSGLIIGAAIQHTGLGKKVTQSLLALPGRASSSYPVAVSLLVLIGTMMCFMMPSSVGRVVLLVPVALLIAARLGFHEGTKGRIGLVMAATLGAYLPSAGILPSNIPNMILDASAQRLYGISFTYSDYFVANFPIAGLMRALFIIVAVCVVFPARGQAITAAIEPQTLTRDSRRLAALLTISVALWATDSIHHISPAWIGLAAAVICLLPKVAFISADSFNQSVSFRALLHIAGIIGLGAVVANSGLGLPLGRALVAVAPFQVGHELWNFFIVTSLSVLVCVLTTTPGLPAVLTPLAPSLAHASGLPLIIILLAQVIGFSTMLFPFQSAPIVIAMHMGGLRTRDVTLMLLIVAAATLFLLTPLTYLWWSSLGYFH